jgi:aldose 1-epimerase
MSITTRSSRAASSIAAPAQTPRHGFETIALRSGDGSTEVEFVPAAHMVCCSLRYDGLELLYPGDGIAAYAERGRTMGIPLLHPWANRLEGVAYRAAGRRVVLPRDQAVVAVDESALPIHGVIPRRMQWQVVVVGRHALVAVFRWRTPELLDVFPFEHELRLEVTIERGRLEIVTTLRATGQEPVPVSFGYHPYLRIPGVDRKAWQVTFAESRRLVLDEWMIASESHCAGDSCGSATWALTMRSRRSRFQRGSESPAVDLRSPPTFSTAFGMAGLYAGRGGLHLL